MDRLDAMAAFVAVAEARGFALAARKLGVSPSVVTRLVAALERRLSIRLLQRTTRSVSLTDAGTRYLERARRILAEVGEAEAAARAERSVPTGGLVVSAPTVFGRLHVAPLLSEFLTRYPSVNGRLALSDKNANLVDERVDVAVRIGKLADSTLRARIVGETRRVLVASPEYVRERAPIAAPSDLNTHPLIHVHFISPRGSWILEREGREVEVRVAPRFSSNSADVAMLHAERGGGVAQVFSYQAWDALRAGRLVRVLCEWEPPPIPIQLVHPSRRPAASVRAFIDLVLERRGWDFASPG